MKRSFPNVAAIICVFALVTACGGSSGNTTNSDNGASQDNGVGDAFVNFESGQVRPLALSADGTRLYATNTPNATLDIFAVSDNGLAQIQSIPVGLEPVAVATYGNDEVWVVNHLSDSVSVVDVSVEPARVTKTLLVGDEPRDIVFASTNRQLAFITATHRGQNGPDDTPIDPELETSGVGRADLWVFDATNTGASLGGDPLSVTTLFGDSLRALVSSVDGSKIYASVMHSGNQTTAIGENQLAKPGPTTSKDGALQPDTGLIIQFDGDTWRDETASDKDLNGTIYNSLVPFSLPDYDVFELSAQSNPAVLRKISSVGTTLFNMAINPVSGALYVSNTEALNVNRFEGHSTTASTLTGNFAQSRITTINSDSLAVSNLNPHLDHAQPQATASERSLSVAQPVGMVLSDDASTLYVAAFASKKVVAYNSEDLAAGAIENTAANQVALSGGGPTGLVLDRSRKLLYVLTRFNNSISTIDVDAMTETDTVALHNPEPITVKDGREFLYDASNTSGHGDSSCGLCHVFGDTDALAWDLGNPDASVQTNPNAFVNNFLKPDNTAVFHPLKGPMTTQSLRGLANAGPMHWRGDRTGISAENNESLELAAFKDFNVAFPELLGREQPLSAEDIEKFAQFALTIHYPPNPIRALDNSLTASQARGLDTYMNKPTTGEIFTCNDCHTLDPANGHFGTSGHSSVEGSDISQEFKVPHLRNMYQKVGKFGNSGRFSGTEGDFGPQIRGYGFMHDGNMDTLDNFFKGEVFSFATDPQLNETMRQEVVDFVMAFDTNLAPVVGQQITLSSATGPDTDSRLELLMQRALVDTPGPECDLIAKGVVEGKTIGYLLQADDQFMSDTAELLNTSDLRDRALQAGGEITFTCVPPGTGQWMGIDRNLDGTLDGQL